MVSSNEYPLGNDPAELARLDHQGRLLAPATRTLFQSAGIQPGMRVLDLGSGAGDVSLLVAELVGPAGEVIGVDRSPEACATATLRATQRGLRNTQFIVGDIHQPAPVEPVDAIVCRLVLMYLPDPATVLKTQAARLRSGGVVAPVELDITAAGSTPPTPLVMQVLSWLGTAFKRAGIDTTLGRRLWSVAREAGLQPRGMVGVQPYFGPEDHDGMALLAGVVRAILPVIERTGVATRAEVDIDSLADRMLEEVRAAGAVFAHPTLCSAWSTAD